MKRFCKFISVVLVTSIITSPPAFSGGGFTGGGGGSGSVSVSDAAYDATTWDGDTTNAPSKNAIRDKIESMVGASANFFTDASTTGHVTYVGCSDSIATAITNATAGDTLVLGACSYAISASLIVNKSLRIVGQGPEATKITATFVSDDNMIDVTAAPFSLRNIYLTGTRVAAAVDVDATSGNVFSYKDVLFDNVIIDITNSTGNTIDGVFFHDSGFVVKDSKIKVNLDTPGISTAQAKTIHTKHLSSQEASVTGYIINTTNECSITNASNVNQVSKCIMNWNNAADPSVSTSYLYVVNSYSVSGLSGANGQSFGLLNEGPDTVSYLINSVFDGGTGLTSGKNSDVYANGNSVTGNIVYSYGSVMVNGNESANNGATINQLGEFLGGSVNLTGAPSPGSVTSATGTPGKPIISAISGTAGGASTIATTGTGGIGSSATITLGTGGVANSANTASTGGKGGSYALTAGTGGAASVASGTNVGGAGGDISLTAGTGGAAASGSSNTGGAAGNITLTYGAVGSGGSPSGGSITLAGNSESIFQHFNTGTNQLTTGSNTGIVNYLWDGLASIVFGVDRIATANTAGKTLTINAGGATVSAADKSGGDLVLNSGKSTGSGTSNIIMKTFPGVAGSTSDNSLQTSLYIQGSTNNVGLKGNITPTLSLAFAPGTQSFGIDRRASGSTAGGTLTVQAGGAFATSTDVAGGTLVLAPGTSTGTANAKVSIQGYTTATSTGSSDNTAVDRLVVTGAKSLTDAATSLFEIALPTTKMCGGVVRWTIEASDGTNHQALSGITSFSAVNKAGAYTMTATNNTDNDASAVSSGTLTSTWALVSGTNKVTMQVTPTGSLTETIYRITYVVENNSPQALTIL